MNVEDDNMRGTFNQNDIALIIKFHNKKFKEKHLKMEYTQLI